MQYFLQELSENGTWKDFSSQSPLEAKGTKKAIKDFLTEKFENGEIEWQTGFMWKEKGGGTYRIINKWGEALNP